MKEFEPQPETTRFKKGDKTLYRQDVYTVKSVVPKTSEKQEYIIERWSNDSHGEMTNHDVAKVVEEDLTPWPSPK